MEKHRTFFWETPFSGLCFSVTLWCFFLGYEYQIPIEELTPVKDFAPCTKAISDCYVTIVRVVLYSWDLCKGKIEVSPITYVKWSTITKRSFALFLSCKDKILFHTETELGEYYPFYRDLGPPRNRVYIKCRTCPLDRCCFYYYQYKTVKGVVRTLFVHRHFNLLGQVFIA